MLTSLSFDVSLLSVCGRREVWIAGFHSPSILHRLALDWKQYLVNAKNRSDTYEPQSLNFRHFIFNQVAQMCFAALKLQLLQKNNAELTFSKPTNLPLEAVSKSMGESQRKSKVFFSHMLNVPGCVGSALTSVPWEGTRGSPATP